MLPKEASVEKFIKDNMHPEMWPVLDEEKQSLFDTLYQEALRIHLSVAEVAEFKRSLTYVINSTS